MSDIHKKRSETGIISNCTGIIAHISVDRLFLATCAHVQLPHRKYSYVGRTQRLKILRDLSMLTEATKVAFCPKQTPVASAV